MRTTKNPTNIHDDRFLDGLREEGIDLLAEAGFLPSDDTFPGVDTLSPKMLDWIQRRYEAILHLGSVLLLANIHEDDERIHLEVTNLNGVTFEELDFSLTSRFGKALFQATVKTLADDPTTH